MWKDGRGASCSLRFVKEEKAKRKQSVDEDEQVKLKAVEKREGRERKEKKTDGIS